MGDVVYTLHTEGCTYVLDEFGVCRWIVSRAGDVPPEAATCIGAQFVACVDAGVAGYLTSELLVGASALFAGTSPETGRAVLLRTTPIARVERRTTHTPIYGGPDAITEPETIRVPQERRRGPSRRRVDETAETQPRGRRREGAFREDDSTTLIQYPADPHARPAIRVREPGEPPPPSTPISLRRRRRP